MMRPLDDSQLRIMSQVLEFTEECAANGLQIEQGQAFECLLEPDPVRQARLARRFHNLNIRIGKSCGQIHLQNEPDDFDLPAPVPKYLLEEEEEDLIEKIRVIPAKTRNILISAVMELRRPGGPHTICGAAAAIGVSRPHFYKLLKLAKWWVTRPPAPEGWSSIDCPAPVQLELELGVAQ